MTIVDFCEKVLGLQLMDYQKKYLEYMVSENPPIYITIPRRLGYTNYKKLVEEYEHTMHLNDGP